MRFRIRATSGTINKIISVESLEDLVSLIDKYGSDIIISYGQGWFEDEPEDVKYWLEVYDDYRE